MPKATLNTLIIWTEGDRPFEVKALPYKIGEAFAVHATVQGNRKGLEQDARKWGWTVTHVPTGAGVEVGLPNKECALAYKQALLRLGCADVLIHDEETARAALTVCGARKLNQWFKQQTKKRIEPQQLLSGLKRYSR